LYIWFVDFMLLLLTTDALACTSGSKLFQLFFDSRSDVARSSADDWICMLFSIASSTASSTERLRAKSGKERNISKTIGAKILFFIFTPKKL